MNKKKKKTNLEELYERMLKEYDKDHPGMRSLMRQINADKKYKYNNYKSVRNIPNVKITDVNHFSAYDLAKFKKVIFTETSIKELEKRY